jgi:hypothetical protein
MRTGRRVVPAFERLEGKALTSRLVGHAGRADGPQPPVIEEWGKIAGNWISEIPHGDTVARQILKGEGFVEPVPGPSQGQGLLTFPTEFTGGMVSGALSFHLISDARQRATVIIHGPFTPGPTQKLSFSDFAPHLDSGNVVLTETTAQDGHSGSFTMVFTVERYSRHGR